MKRSRIEWTDYSGGPLNFVVRGHTPGDCERSIGCAHCYVLRMHKRWRNLPETTTWYPEKLEKLAVTKFPQDGNRRGPGRRPMAFVCDTGDLFHPSVPFEFIREARRKMALRDDVIWQVLTKRPERLCEFTRWLGQRWNGRPPMPWPENVWIGASFSTQEDYDYGIDELLRTPASVHFVSLEPLLERIEMHQALTGYLYCERCGRLHPMPYHGECSGCAYHGMYQTCLDWIIIGGESGTGSRLFRADWVDRTLDDCSAAGVPAFVKQMGRYLALRRVHGRDTVYSLGDREGRDMQYWHAAHRVRQWPEAA